MRHMRAKRQPRRRPSYSSSEPIRSELAWSQASTGRAAISRVSSLPLSPIGHQILMVNAANEREFHAAFAKVVQAGAGGLLIGSGPFFLSQRRQLVTLAGRHALPTMYNQREYAEVGGLISYGPSQSDAYRRAGVYVGRILKGERPGDLPVEAGAKFELVINLATAKALSVEIPPTLLALADEVIE